MTAVIVAVLAGAAMLSTPAAVEVRACEPVRWWLAWRASRATERADDAVFFADARRINIQRRNERRTRETIQALKRLAVCQ